MKITVVSEGAIWKNPYPSVRSVYCWHGHTENLGGGELIHAARVGQAKTSSDCRCLMLRSTDHGTTWSETSPLVPDAERDTQYSYFTSRLKLASDGKLWASSIRFNQVEPEDPRWTRDNSGWIGCENFICHSTDRGLSWSKPSFVGPKPSEHSFPTLATPVYELDTGELMLVFESFFRKTIEKMHHQVTAIYSRDGGISWGEPNLVAQDPADRVIYFDPRFARLANGRWLCLFWTHDKKTDEALNTTIAYSEDGHVWTQPEPTQLCGFPTLPLALPDGRLFAVYNFRRQPQGVRCSISEDGGKMWDLNHEYVLWDQAARQVTGELASENQKRKWEGSCMAEMFTWDFGVPDPVLLDDGSILVTFYATQMDHVTHQRYIRIRVDG